MRKATSVGRDQLISLGICFGKFTKTGKFRMHVTCLDYIAQYAKVKTLAELDLLLLLSSMIRRQSIAAQTRKGYTL
jgi:hypothetical protein